MANFWAAELADVRPPGPPGRPRRPGGRPRGDGPRRRRLQHQLRRGPGRRRSWPPATRTARFATYQRYYGRRIQDGAVPLAPGHLRWTTSAVLLDSGRPPSAPSRRSTSRCGLATEGVVDAYQLHFYESVEALPGAARLPRPNGSATPCRSRRGRSGSPGPGTSYDERTPGRGGLPAGRAPARPRRVRGSSTSPWPTPPATGPRCSAGWSTRTAPPARRARLGGACTDALDRARRGPGHRPGRRPDRRRLECGQAGRRDRVGHRRSPPALPQDSIDRCWTRPAPRSTATSPWAALPSWSSAQWARTCWAGS